MKRRKYKILLMCLLLINNTFAVEILQRNNQGEYIWFLHSFIGSSGLGVNTNLKENEKTRTLFLPVVKSCAEKYNVDWRLVDIVIKAESAYNKRIYSPKGAYGFMQLMPITAKELGVDRYSPKDNICGGVKYLSLLLKQFNDLPLVLAAYNAGAGNVRKYGGVPPFKETKKYVKKIIEQYSFVR